MAARDTHPTTKSVAESNNGLRRQQYIMRNRFIARGSFVVRKADPVGRRHKKLISTQVYAIASIFSVYFYEQAVDSPPTPHSLLLGRLLSLSKLSRKHPEGAGWGGAWDIPDRFPTTRPKKGINKMMEDKARRKRVARKGRNRRGGSPVPVCAAATAV